MIYKKYKNFTWRKEPECQYSETSNSDVNNTTFPGETEYANIGNALRFLIGCFEFIEVKSCKNAFPVGNARHKRIP